MPVFYNYTEGGYVYSFDDVFVPADAFRQGNLWGFGNNSLAQLGDNTLSDRSIPVTTLSGGANWRQSACGRSHTAAIKTDGTLWTWGLNSYGQLGDNTTNSKSIPITTFAGGTNWKQVSCGGYHTSAIKTDGTLWTWGSNIISGGAANGQLGINATTNNRPTPVTTFAGGTNWKQVACGFYYTSSIKTDGTLWTWGNNGNGQLGDNTTTNRSTPVQVFGSATNWKQVSCGYSHVAAIKTDGTLWTWGNNGNGQLGDNTTTQRNTPVQVFGSATNWKQVACGNNSTAAIKTDGTLWTWGSNGSCQLGTNDTTQRNTPVTTFAGGTNWKQVAGGTSHTSSIKTDGTLWVWGTGGNGRLGINATTNRTTPVTTFAGGTNWKQVAGGYTHTIATTYIDSYL